MKHLAFEVLRGYKFAILAISFVVVFAAVNTEERALLVQQVQDTTHIAVYWQSVLDRRGNPVVSYQTGLMRCLATDSPEVCVDSARTMVEGETNSLVDTLTFILSNYIQVGDTIWFIAYVGATDDLGVPGDRSYFDPMLVVWEDTLVEDTLGPEAPTIDSVIVIVMAPPDTIPPEPPADSLAEPPIDSIVVIDDEPGDPDVIVTSDTVAASFIELVLQITDSATIRFWYDGTGGAANLDILVPEPGRDYYEWEILLPDTVLAGRDSINQHSRDDTVTVFLSQSLDVFGRSRFRQTTDSIDLVTQWSYSDTLVISN